jgi:hypothetical protein
MIFFTDLFSHIFSYTNKSFGEFDHLKAPVDSQIQLSPLAEQANSNLF